MLLEVEIIKREQDNRYELYLNELCVPKNLNHLTHYFLCYAENDLNAQKKKYQIERKDYMLINGFLISINQKKEGKGWHILVLDKELKQIGNTEFNKECWFGFVPNNKTLKKLTNWLNLNRQGSLYLLSVIEFKLIHSDFINKLAKPKTINQKPKKHHILNDLLHFDKKTEQIKKKRKESKFRAEQNKILKTLKKTHNLKRVMFYYKLNAGVVLVKRYRI